MQTKVGVDILPAYGRLNVQGCQKYGRSKLSMDALILNPIYLHIYGLQHEQITDESIDTSYMRQGLVTPRIGAMVRVSKILILSNTTW